MRFSRTTLSMLGVILILVILRSARTETQTPPPLAIAQLSASVAALEAEVDELQAQVTNLENALAEETAARQAADATLQQNVNNAVPANLLDLAEYVSVDPNTLNELVGPHIIFTGANVHIRNGLGATNGNAAVLGNIGSPAVLTNGLGNLVVGYNEKLTPIVNRSGSHNVVLGIDNQYSKFGGLVAGVSSKSLGQYASVSGGLSNTANGNLASVSGGFGNTASGGIASVSGGVNNLASGASAWVAGGVANAAPGGNASVSGGRLNIASGVQASVSGGEQNVASGLRASVSGGFGNTASGEFTSVSGGQNVVNGFNFSWSGGLLTSP